MKTFSPQQQKIADWFDQTYLKRGNLYLRPKEAYYIFLELMNCNAKERLLDIACGLGRMLEVGLEKEMNVSGIDISSVAIKECQARFAFADVRIGNAEELPYSDGQFDYVSCLGSLERMIDRSKALSEMRRVLDDHGLLCLLVRNSESWKWRYIKRPFGLVNNTGHQDAKNLVQWKNLLNENGWYVEDVLCDQWPIMKLKRLASLGIWKNFKKVQPGIFPLKYANEFLFICRKQDR